MKKRLVILLFLIAGCTIVEKPAYTLFFTIQESGQPVDGNVYLKGNFLGRTKGGELGVLLSNMSEGPLNFAGYFSGRPFNYTYSISTDHLSSRKLSFTVEQASLDTFTIIFGVNGTNELLDGIVFNNDLEIGRTSNGKLSMPYKDIEEGRITIKGTYRGEAFEFRFSLDDDELKNAVMSFLVSKKELDSELFDAADIDRLKVEQKIVDLVNAERSKVGTPLLKWNSKAASVAYSHSLDMSTKEYFAHASPEGDNVGERLKKSLVFYTVAAEDLSFFDNILPETDIAKKSVEGWMNSPGHRAPILDSDGLFSDAGAGVSCSQKTCYVTLVFIGNERSVETDLPEDYLSFYYLYDPNFGFDSTVPVRVKADSTSPISVYIVSGRGQYEQLVKGQSTDYLEKFSSVSKVDEEYSATPGMGIVLENKGEAQAEVTLHIDYYP